MKFLSHPIVKTVAVVLGVMLALPYIRPLVKNVPILNKL